MTAHGSSKLILEDRLLIGDQWVAGSSAVSFPVMNPATEEIIATLAGASPAEVDRAIAAARCAFDEGPWGGMTPRARSEILHRWVDLAEANREMLEDILVAEVGTPISLARAMQTGVAFDQGRWLADVAARGPRGGWEEGLGLHTQPVDTASILVREPIGVVLAITAFNYPVIMFVAKVFAALAAGCSAVVMPNPRTPLATLAFARLGLEAGVPPGQINVVVGDPAGCKQATEHPDVDMVSFTGSVEVGREIARQAAASIKKVTLELGGKSPNILLPGVPVTDVVGPSLLRFARNAGQSCGGTTRILVHEDDADEFVDEARGFIDRIKVGDPLDPTTDVGPLIRGENRDRVEGFVERAVAGGAEVLAGGGRPDLPTGFYVKPTLIGGVQNDDEICQEELFGPVGALLTYATVDEAVDMANRTRFGLNGNVYGPPGEAIEVARRIRSGTVTVNAGGGARPDAPYGGYRQSGIGRELGEEGFLEFFELKHIQWPLASVGMDPGARR